MIYKKIRFIILFPFIILFTILLVPIIMLVMLFVCDNFEDFMSTFYKLFVDF